MSKVGLWARSIGSTKAVTVNLDCPECDFDGTIVNLDDEDSFGNGVYCPSCGELIEEWNDGHEPD